MKPVLRRVLSVTAFLLLLAGCRGNTPPDVNFRSHEGTEQVATGNTVDFTNEAMPQTTDSLEVSTGSGGSALIRAVSGGILIGRADAPVLTVYTDDACDYCREFAASKRGDILRNFVDQGTISLQIVFVPQSDDGIFMAKVSLCALRQNRFMETDRELSATPITSDRDLPALAKKTQLSLKTLRACIAEKKIGLEISTAVSTARSAGAVRVPFFTLNNASWTGLMEDDELARAVQEALKR